MAKLGRSEWRLLFCAGVLFYLGYQRGEKVNDKGVEQNDEERRGEVEVEIR